MNLPRDRSEGITAVIPSVGAIWGRRSTYRHQPERRCRARARVAICAAILAPLGAAQRRSVPVIHEEKWGGLRGLNPQPSEPQSDGRQPCVVAAPGKGTTTLPQPVCPPTYQQTLSASVTVEYSVH